MDNSTVTPHVRQFAYRAHSSKSYNYAPGCIPLFIDSVDRPVAFVDGPTLQKRVNFSKHLLLKPRRAIAFDNDILRQATTLGAKNILVIDADSHDSYTTTIETFRAYSFPVNRRFGDQSALALDYWQRNGQPSTFEVREAARAAQPVQMSLWEVA